ncbi:MAG: hypothetical protein HPY83_15755 [Anaerolineae bacterium]|nr:hypothetical protein [Anaerolineae bacterium]
MERRLALLILAVIVPLVVGPRVVGADGAMPLSAYPRPRGDNGWGIHWSPTLFAQPTDMVDRFVAETERMGCTWVKLLQGDAPKLEHEHLIKRLTERGIMPVLRVYRPWNTPYLHLGELVRLGVPLGVHYYELYNEPNLAGEAGGWRPGESISVEHLADVWIEAAEEVLAAGGLPSLPPLAPGGDYDDVRFLRDFLSELRQRGRLDLLHRAWLPLHNYFLNHPLDYPYDAVNRESTPLSQDEAARRGLSPEEASRINHFRAISHLPRDQGGYYVGDTVYQDSNGFLKFQAYARIMQEEAGFVVPIITTEGGAIIGSAEDPRYPPVTEADLVELTLAARDYMAQQAPEYYFAFMPWLLANRAGNSLSANWESAAWLKDDGSSLAVVAALQDRSFGASPTSGPAAGVEAAGRPEGGPRTEGPSRRVELLQRRFQVPDVNAVAEASSPAHPRYPLPVVPEGVQPPEVERTLDVVVLRNAGAEAWLLPELGARLVRLAPASGPELLPLVERFSFHRHDSVAHHLEGGVRWLYPSPPLSIAEGMPWSVEATGSDPEPHVTLSCTEPRSRTELTLRLTLASDGSLAADLAAHNVSAQTRVVSLGASSSAPSLAVTVTGPAEVSLSPGSVHRWRILIAAASDALQGVAAPESSPTASAAQPASPAAARRPVALVTPVPAVVPPLPSLSHEAPRAPATPSVPDPATPAPPSAARARSWDPRLDALGVSLERAATGRWELVEASFEDERESGGNHHIYIRLLGADSLAANDAPWVAWPDGRETLEPRREGSEWVADFPMYGPLGAYSVGVGPSGDRVTGLGLPARHHVNFRLTFRRRD